MRFNNVRCRVAYPRRTLKNDARESYERRPQERPHAFLVGRDSRDTLMEI